MEWADVMSSITTVGFPVVMCVAMGYYVKYITDKNRQEVSDLNRQHQEELQEITTAINNNTLALQKLCDKMEG